MTGSVLRGRTSSAFSLVEIILALGVISFALVGIMGLFPVALKSATSSQRETQMGVIARSIFTDLISQNGPARKLYLGSESDPAKPGTSANLDLAQNNATLYLGFSREGTPLSTPVNATQYDTGKSDAGYLAKVTVTRLTPPNEKLSRVEIVVGSPGVAAASRRETKSFVTMFPNGQ